MTSHRLAFKPAIGIYGQHDPSAALFEDGQLVYAVEEERLTRQKHAVATFNRGVSGLPRVNAERPRCSNRPSVTISK